MADEAFPIDTEGLQGAISRGGKTPTVYYVGIALDFALEPVPNRGEVQRERSWISANLWNAGEEGPTASDPCTCVPIS